MRKKKSAETPKEDVRPMFETKARQRVVLTFGDACFGAGGRYDFIKELTAQEAREVAYALLRDAEKIDPTCVSLGYTSSTCASGPGTTWSLGDFS